MLRSIHIDGTRYSVMEDVSIPGLRMVVVDTSKGQRTAVRVREGRPDFSTSSPWRWWTAKDRQ